MVQDPKKRVSAFAVQKSMQVDSLLSDDVISTPQQGRTLPTIIILGLLLQWLHWLYYTIESQADVITGDYDTPQDGAPFV